MAQIGRFYTENCSRASVLSLNMKIKRVGNNKFNGISVSEKNRTTLIQSRYGTNWDSFPLLNKFISIYNYFKIL